MHTLYCTPLGETVRGQFVGALVAALAEGGAAGQAYLLPSSFLLNEVRRDLAAASLRGHEQPNLLTFDGLAAAIVDQSGGRIFMSRMAQELVVAEVLDELTAAGRLPYFGRIASFPGLVGAVTSLLAEIKRSGASPEEFAAVAEARDWPQKDREISAVYDVYQRRLAARGLADLEEMYFLAAAALRDGAELPYRRFYISEFYILTPLQLELMRGLCRGAAVDIGLVYEKNRPEVFAAVEPTYSGLVGMGFTPVFTAPVRRSRPELEHIRRRLFSPLPETVNGGGIEVLGCPGPAREMALVAGRIKKLLLDGVCRPEEIAVVSRDPAAYAAFREVAAEYGIPVELPREEPLARQPVARFAAAAMTARLENGSRAAVLSLLKFGPAAAAYGFDADELERLARRRLVRGWPDWLAVGGEQPSGLERLYEAVCLLPPAGACRDFTAALSGLLAGLRLPQWLGKAYKAGELPPDRLKAGLLACARIEEVLTGMAEGFAAAGQERRKLSLAEFAGLFQQAIADVRLQLEGYPDGGVRVVSPARASGATFRAVFVMGLADGMFPQRGRENWLYDERERAALSGLGLSLATFADRRLEEDLYFAVSLALAEDRLTLSFPEDARTLPSPYVEEVLQLFDAGSVGLERFGPSQLFPAAAAEVYSARELARKALADAAGAAGEVAPGREALTDYVLTKLVDEDFVRRLAAERERGRVGGVFSGAAAAEGACYSITALEDYAQCPFAYYAKRVLRLEEWEEKDEEAGFDVIGNLYHETLSGFLRSHAGESLKAERTEKYWRELWAVFDAACGRMAAAGAIAPGRVWDWRRRRLEETLRRWLDFEIAEQNAPGLAFTPAYLEWGFGLPVRPGMDPASVAAPLVIGSGGETLAVVGKVDRIDRAGDTLAVTDFKRKTCPKFSELVRGTDLQAALYIMAVERFLCPAGGQVAGGGYYSVEARRKEGGMWRAELAGEIGHRAAKLSGNLDTRDWEERQAELCRQALAAGAGIRAGDFRPRPAAECPPYCVARDVCRYRRDEAYQGGGEANG